MSFRFDKSHFACQINKSTYPLPSILHALIIMIFFCTFIKANTLNPSRLFCPLNRHNPWCTQLVNQALSVCRIDLQISHRLSMMPFMRLDKNKTCYKCYYKREICIHSYDFTVLISSSDSTGTWLYAVIVIRQLVI